MMIQILWPAFAILGAIATILSIIFAAITAEARTNEIARKGRISTMICLIVLLASVFLAVYGCRVVDYPYCPKYCELPAANQVVMERP